MNVALGFDTYLVMRHGLPSSSERKIDSAQVKPGSIYRGQLGCYYCNDVVAPMDVSLYRSLEAQRAGSCPADETQPRAVFGYAVSQRSDSRSDVHGHQAWNCEHCQLDGGRAHGVDSAAPERVRARFVRPSQRRSTDSSPGRQPACAIYNSWSRNRIVGARTSRDRRGGLATRNRAASDSRLPRQL